MIALNTLSKCVKDNKFFFAPYFIFLFLGALILIFIPKGDEVVFINRNNLPVLDFVMFYATYVGDGIFLLIMLIPMIIAKMKYFIFLLASFITSGIAAQIFKHIFDLPRPMGFLKAGSIMHFVPGVKVHMLHSFPSGHTATAFSMFLMLSIICKDKRLGALFFLCAIFVGFSRIYLLQHFFIDVYFGSIIGVLFSFLMYLVFTKYWETRKCEWHECGVKKAYLMYKNRNIIND
jgi:membrane-associated phospholipid phosphatase